MSKETVQTPGVAVEDTQPGASDLDRARAVLLQALLPLWARHLSTSRNQSEVAVAQMLSAFEEIGPHLDLAARQSREITAALAQGDDGITQLAQACERELAPVLPRLDSTAAEAVKRVLTMIGRSVAALEQMAKPFEHETQMVGRHVERMYVGLQYQDRISQMMTLLLEDMERLQAALIEPGVDVGALDTDAWLRSLEARYAMAEQRDDHGGASVARDGADPNETTFF